MFAVHVWALLRWSGLNGAVGALLSGVLTDWIRLLIPLESCDPVVPQQAMESFALGNAAEARVCQRLLAEFIEQHPLAGTAAPGAEEILLRRAACEALSTCAYQPSGL